MNNKKRHEQKVVNSLGHVALYQLRDEFFSPGPRDVPRAERDKLVTTPWGKWAWVAFLSLRPSFFIIKIISCHVEWQSREGNENIKVTVEIINYERSSRAKANAKSTRRWKTRKWFIDAFTFTRMLQHPSGEWWCSKVYLALLMLSLHGSAFLFVLTQFTKVPLASMCEK